MEDDLTNSVPSASKPTRKTKELTREETLQVLADVLKKYQSQGGNVMIVPEFWHNGTRGIAVVLQDTTITQDGIIKQGV